MTSDKLKLLSFIFIFSITTNFKISAQLKNISNQTDYIVITPSQFVKTLQPFVDWRQNKGLNVKVVELQQIYYEFPDSSKQYSIKDFISYTLEYWSNPKPRYLLLVGNSKLLPVYKVPSMFVNTAFHEDSVEIDEWYSVNSYQADTKPAVELGRFPVNNVQELNKIIGKTIFFEDSLSFKDYDTDFLFLTDKTDSLLFEDQVRQFIKHDLPLGFSLDTVFASQDSIIRFTTNRLINALNKGTLFLSYYGHGAPYKWSKYNIFAVGDVDSMKVNNLPFIYTAAACDQTFDYPNDSSLVRKLFISDRKGIVASVNSTGLNLSTQGSEYLMNFYIYLFNKPYVTIGDAVLQTKLNLESLGSPEDAIPRRYTLLGDPALKIPFKKITQVDNSTQSIPENYSLKQNYPNPFNPSTTIEYTIPKSAFVTLKVYNILGGEVAVLVDGYRHPGYYKIKFNGNNLSSGVYFYRLQASNYVQIKKSILIK